MIAKKVSEKKACGHSRRMKTMEIKQEIIDKHEHGVRVTERFISFVPSFATVFFIFLAYIISFGQSNMSAKKVSEKKTGGHSRRMMTMESKQEIIERGVRVSVHFI